MTEKSLPCVHCGLCLDTCPTYRILGTEADSPRGRIYLMEAVEGGSLALDSSASTHLDACLSCLACETACPSGVNFHARIDAFRPRLRLGTLQRLRREVVRRLSKANPLLRVGVTVAHALDRVGLEPLRRSLPGLELMPRRRAGEALSSAPPTRRSRIPPPAHPRARVALLAGCAADVLGPQVTRAAVEALHRNGAEVVEVPDQVCCGALALHTGDRTAAAYVRANTKAFANVDVDFVATTAAGCGAMLKQYGSFEPARSALSDAAHELSAHARDITEVLCALGLAQPASPLRFDGPVAYHDACHLLHAAKVTAPPRAVVAAAIGRAPVDLGENALCCGSAGSYNLEKREMARLLGNRKAELVRASGVAAVAVGNVGCMLQLELALARAGLVCPVMHPVELLAESYLRS